MTRNSPLELALKGQKLSASNLETITKERDWIAESLIEYSMNIPPIKPTIFIRDSWACTEDGILLINGQKKAGKSIVLTKLMQSALMDEKNEDETLFINVPKVPKDKEIIYIDTEQSRSRTWDFIGRVFKSAGYKEQPKNLVFYNIKKMLAAEKKTFLEKVIYPKSHKIGLIIFDGVVDFLKSMNDEVEAKNFVGLLFQKIPETVSMVMVMHSGKGNTDGQGHIGQLLEKKAAGTIHIAKDRAKSIHTISSKYIRDTDDFEDINFTWDSANHGFRVLNEGDLKNLADKSEEDRINGFKKLLESIYLTDTEKTRKQLIEGINNRDNTINKSAKPDSIRKAVTRRLNDLIELELVKLDEKKKIYLKNF